MFIDDVDGFSVICMIVVGVGVCLKLGGMFWIEYGYD